MPWTQDARDTRAWGQMSPGTRGWGHKRPRTEEARDTRDWVQETGYKRGRAQKEFISKARQSILLKEMNKGRGNTIRNATQGMAMHI
jgi:hypothetical protein